MIGGRAEESPLLGRPGARVPISGISEPRFLRLAEFRLLGLLLPVPVGYSNPNVPMVKPTQDRQGEHASYALSVARNACVLVQR